MTRRSSILLWLYLLFCVSLSLTVVHFAGMDGLVGMAAGYAVMWLGRLIDRTDEVSNQRPSTG